jgi:putative acetyltransferase
MTPASQLTGGVRIDPLAPDLPAAQALLAASDRYMTALYPAIGHHLESAEGLAQANVLFLGVWVGDALVACGAVKRQQDADADGLAYGEIKRVFVSAEQRGQGLSRLLMQRLEQDLTERGIGLARLETGIRQPEALALYASLGYQRRGPFGGYEVDETGVFMEKRLGF